MKQAGITVGGTLGVVGGWGLDRGDRNTVAA
jgi:hypothetical protein